MGELNIFATNNKRIARNAILLYIRMMVVMLLSLYISRILLKILGVEDFGIYNVVGGVVAMFSYLNSALTAATQRYLNFEMGRNNVDVLGRVFCMSINIHLILALSILVLSETLGLWFLNKYIVIPETRILAANWVYQLSIISTVITIATIPYSALITAHEEMSVYAYISIAEVFLKLGIVFLIQYISIDNLIEYAFFISLVTLLVRIVYIIYCWLNYSESKYHYFWSRSLFKEMFSFTGWNFMGATAGIAMNQGVNILLNIFFGPVVNASRAIAVQVQQAFTQLATNFTMAVNPQIVKSYSADEIDRMTDLVIATSKYTFLIMAVTAMPVFIKIDFLLDVWLVDVPTGTALFTNLLLIYQLTICLTYSINMASQASGKIRLFQIVESVTLILILPIGYGLLKLGMDAASIFIAMIVLSVMALFLRLMVLKKIMDFQVGQFVRRAIIPVLIVSGILWGIYWIAIKGCSQNENLIVNIMQMIAILILSLVIAYWVGLTKNEKIVVVQLARKIFVK